MKTTILAATVRKVGHLNVNIKPTMTEACVLIGWLARVFASLKVKHFCFYVET